MRAAAQVGRRWSARAFEQLERIVGGIRARWPRASIRVRADSGFCREAIMAWCEAQDVEFVLEPARNERLQAEFEP